MLSASLEAFIEAWEEAVEPPPLCGFLPVEETPTRRLALIELIKVDLEYRWKRNAPKPLEEYFRDFPDLAVDPPPDLIYEEYHVRFAAGEDVSIQDYIRRFPARASQLERFFGLHAAEVSTSLGRGSKTKILLAAIRPGEQLGDFDLLTQLGQGAFASVFLARQNSMQRLVALKVSADHGHEPQTLAQLDHEHIVRVFDQRPLPERGMRLLYMQYVAGGTLHGVVDAVRRIPVSERTGRILFDCIDDALLQRGESRPSDSPLRARLLDAPWPEVVCWLGARLARALHYAHRLGILHRDIKPANVLIAADGSPKLADFNISFSAKLAGSSPAAYFGGSLAYMSPEQLEACNVNHERQPDSLDERSDLYSLGVLLWELLTGRRPFPDKEAAGNWSALLSEMVEHRQSGIERPALAEASRTWPRGLGQVLENCLRSDPAERFASGTEVARHLELCLEPAAQKLLSPPARDWRRFARRFPVSCIMAATLIPNILAAIFNYFYNLKEIVEHLEEAKEAFWMTQTIINSIAFPLGSWLAIRLSKPVGFVVRHPERVARMASADLQALRRQCLRLGYYAAWISLALWLVAAPAYPIALRLEIGAEPLGAYVHFVASLTLCGLIASAYPFLGVSCLAVSSFYPTLVRLDTMTRDDLDALRGLSRAAWFYLSLAALVPMLGVAILSVIGSKAQFALEILSWGGMLGLATAFLLFRTLQADSNALTVLAAPPDEHVERDASQPARR